MRLKEIQNNSHNVLPESEHITVMPLKILAFFFKLLPINIHIQKSKNTAN